MFCCKIEFPGLSRFDAAVMSYDPRHGPDKPGNVRTMFGAEKPYPSFQPEHGPTKQFIWRNIQNNKQDKVVPLRGRCDLDISSLFVSY